ncbi:hypothetical protein KKG41_04890, partial [Patescibacteria group bacterium]|nr:hypothetical protein [Patescibacteria group bacterium]MBU1890841.1 hypothetical protein [Patescibacteria group bacterium]
YVGLEPIRRKQFKIEQIRKYLPHLKKFVNEAISPRMHSIIEEELFSYFRKNQIHLDHGYSVYIIQELPDDRAGSSKSGVLNSLFSAVLVDIGRLKMQDIENWKKLPSKKLFNTSSDFFKYLRLVVNFHAKVSPWIIMGSSLVVSFLNSKYPIVLFPKEELPEFRIQYQNTYEKPQQSERLFDPPIQFYRFEEMFNKGLSNWPFDFGLIFTGSFSDECDRWFRLDQVGNYLAHSVSYNRQIFDKKLSVNLKRPPLFYKLVNNADRKFLWKHHLSSWIMNDLMILYALRKCFYYGFNEGNAKELLRLFGNQSLFIRLFDWKSGKLDDIVKHIKDYFNKREELFDVFTDSYSLNRKLVFVGERGQPQQIMQELLAQLKKKYSKEVSLDYISWVDGLEPDGLRIEQSLNEAKSSPILPVGMTKSLVWKRELQPKQYLLTPRLKEAFIHYMDIAIDFEDHKIIIKGKALTSKQIHSTSATKEILECLLSKYGRIVNGSDIPVEAYRDRNELQSKIIGPLKKVARKKLLVNLPIEITGKLGKNYSIKIKPNDLKIAVIKPIM